MVKDEFLEVFEVNLCFQKFLGWNIIWKNVGSGCNFGKFQVTMNLEKIGQIAIQKRFGVEMYFGRDSG